MASEPGGQVALHVRGGCSADESVHVGAAQLLVGRRPLLALSCATAWKCIPRQTCTAFTYVV